MVADLEQRDPMFYNTLTCTLNDEQRKSVHEIFTLADQRKAAALSKEIQKRGGKLNNLLITLRYVELYDSCFRLGRVRIQAAGYSHFLQLRWSSAQLW